MVQPQHLHILPFIIIIIITIILLLLLLLFEKYQLSTDGVIEQYCLSNWTVRAIARTHLF